MRLLLCVLLLGLGVPASAQEGGLGANFRHESDEIRDSCGEFALKTLGGCVMQLATADPVHVALGNLAPQNGFGLGLAFVDHYTPNERWRLSWNADGVSTMSGSWRLGGYMKIIHTDVQLPGVVTGSGSPVVVPGDGIREYPVFNVYAETTSLKKLFFFGPGQTSLESGRSTFAERQTIVGTTAVVPFPRSGSVRGLRVSLIGGVNGRFLNVRGRSSDSNPGIDQLYSDGSAPGLSAQPNFVQFQEGVRLKPSWAGGRVQANYHVDFHQFLGGSKAGSSFHRWSVDVKHDFPLYGNSRSTAARDTNGPDECWQGPTSSTCPPVSESRNRGGTITFRLFLTQSAGFSGDAVPFYFQPTLGGSDINGNRFLPSYDDYRFRGPKLIALQESFEHSLWGPVGLWFLADQGKVALEQESLDLNDLKHSFEVGLTLRAGGFPQFIFAFAWGGGEGHHVSGIMSSSLLGGSARPSLH